MNCQWAATHLMSPTVRRRGDTLDDGTRWDDGSVSGRTDTRVGSGQHSSGACSGWRRSSSRPTPDRGDSSNSRTSRGKCRSSRGRSTSTSSRGHSVTTGTQAPTSYGPVPDMHGFWSSRPRLPDLPLSRPNPTSVGTSDTDVSANLRSVGEPFFRTS